jgi:hypothetical protein
MLEFPRYFFELLFFFGDIVLNAIYLAISHMQHNMLVSELQAGV